MKNFIFILSLSLISCVETPKSEKELASTNSLIINKNKAKTATKFVTSSLNLEDAFKIILKDISGSADDSTQLLNAKKLILKEKERAETLLEDKIKNQMTRMSLELNELLFLVKEVGLTDTMRNYLFMILETEVEEVVKHHEVSIGKQVKAHVLDILFIDLKQKNESTKNRLISLLRHKKFSEKLKVVDALLKLKDSNRRSMQMYLKKVLPREKHYLLFRK